LRSSAKSLKSAFAPDCLTSTTRSCSGAHSCPASLSASRICRRSRFRWAWHPTDLEIAMPTKPDPVRTCSRTNFPEALWPSLKISSNRAFLGPLRRPIGVVLGHADASGLIVHLSSPCGLENHGFCVAFYCWAEKFSSLLPVPDQKNLEGARVPALTQTTLGQAQGSNLRALCRLTAALRGPFPGGNLDQASRIGQTSGNCCRSRCDRAHKMSPRSRPLPALIRPIRGG
jgi:hypothetical protein